MYHTQKLATQCISWWLAWMSRRWFLQSGDGLDDHFRASFRVFGSGFFGALVSSSLVLTWRWFRLDCDSMMIRFGYNPYHAKPSNLFSFDERGPRRRHPRILTTVWQIILCLLLFLNIFFYIWMWGFIYNSYIIVFGKHFSTRISIIFVNKISIKRVILNSNVNYGSLKRTCSLEKYFICIIYYIQIL